VKSNYPQFYVDIEPTHESWSETNMYYFDKPQNCMIGCHVNQGMSAQGALGDVASNIRQALDDGWTGNMFNFRVGDKDEFTCSGRDVGELAGGVLRSITRPSLNRRSVFVRRQ
jgi:hypothetical protein